MVPCFVGLGANIGLPMQQLKEAVRGLANHASIRHLQVSPVYRSPPMGPEDQPDYLNAVARLETDLDASRLLSLLQDLEQHAGRTRGLRWGPRTLDLDLLLYGSARIDTPALNVPHPGLEQRAFVLLPLQDLVGADFTLPSGARLERALLSCPASQVRQVAEAAELLATLKEAPHGQQ